MTDALSGPLIEEQFLTALVKRRTPVAVFLVGGVKLQGNLSGFDGFTVAMHRNGLSQLVYKHAIASIMPMDGAST